MVKKITLERLDSIFEKIINKGLKIKQVQEMNLQEYNRTFQVGLDRKGTKLKKIRTNYNLEGQKRLLTQIKNNNEKVIQNFFKKRQIEDRTYQDFIRKRYRDLFTQKKKYKFGKKLRTGEYYLVHLKNGKKSFFIKAKDSDSFSEQIKTLQESKGFEDFKLKSITIYKYNEFISREMNSILEQLHLD